MRIQFPGSGNPSLVSGPSGSCEKQVKKYPPFDAVDRSLHHDLTLPAHQRLTVGLDAEMSPSGGIRKRNVEVPNATVPQFDELQDLRRVLLERLELLFVRKRNKRRDQKVIHHVDEKDCFSTICMYSTLEDILGGEKAVLKYVSEESIMNLSQPHFPHPRSEAIYILGGSLDDAYTPSGMAFIETFCLPLVEKIVQEFRTFVLGICFGHQSLLGTFKKPTQRTKVTPRSKKWDRLKGDLQIMTEPREAQFGFFPVVFESGVHPALEHLADGKEKTVAFTRSGWPIANVPFDAQSQIRTAAQLSGVHKRSGRTVPPGVSFLDGHVVGFQFHPEIQFDKEGHYAVMREFYRTEVLKRRRVVEREDVFGWREDLKRNLTAAIFIPLLLYFVNRLLDMDDQKIL